MCSAISLHEKKISLKTLPGLLQLRRIAQVTKTLQQQKNYNGALLMAEYLLVNEHDPLAAANQLAPLAPFSTKIPRLATALGIIAFHNHDADAAKQFLQSALKQDPEDPGAKRYWERLQHPQEDGR